MTSLETLIGSMKERAAEHGLSVRCPVCNAGAGKWCRIDMADQSSKVIKHAERVELAREAALDLLTDAMSGEYQRTTANPPIPKRRADVTVSLDDI